MFFAQAREHAGHGLCHRKQFFHWHEFGKHLGLIRHRPQAAADKQLKPTLAIPDLGQRAHIVHIDQPTRLTFAARERDFEFPPKILRIRMAKQEARQRLGIRRHVKRLRSTDPRDRAGSHVADGVAARFAGRDPDRRQPAHAGRGVLDVDEMQLKVLPGGDVQNTIGIFFGNIRQDLQLFGGDAAKRNLDALHPRRIPRGVRPFGQPGVRIGQPLRLETVEPLGVIVPLAIRPAAQARFCEKFLVDLAQFAQFHLRLKNINFLAELGRNL